jgi:hypothetical protein
MLLLLSTQLFDQPVDADGSLELYPSRLLQSLTDESRITNPNEMKIATPMKSASIDIKDVFSTMIIQMMQN